MIVAMETGRCSKCREEKPRAAFSASDKNRSGLHSHCRQCVSAASSAWYARNRARHHANGKAWSAKNQERTKELQARHYKKHTAKRRANAKAWRLANPEMDRARKKAYCTDNRAKIREYERDYRQRRPDVARRKDSKKRARKAAAFVEHVDVGVLFRRDRGICGICKQRVLSNDKSVDHIVPLARGGEHSYKNTQLAHIRCNSSKGARSVIGQLRLVG